MQIKFTAAAIRQRLNFLREKLHPINSTLKLIISLNTGEVGTTAMFNGIMSKYNAIPFVPKTSMDIEDYVTNKAADGLFAMVGQEEKKIRTDPAARTTDVLKSVFWK